MSAASAADDFSINNYDDWYLPLINYLLEMNDKIGFDTSGNLHNVGGFSTEPYWSSTQNEEDRLNSRMSQLMFHGDVSFPKTLEFTGRPIWMF